MRSTNPFCSFLQLHAQKIFSLKQPSCINFVYMKSSNLSKNNQYKNQNQTLLVPNKVEYMIPNKLINLHLHTHLAFICRPMFMVRSVYKKSVLVCVCVLWKIEGKEKGTRKGEAAKQECSPLCFEVHKLLWVNFTYLR